MIINNSLKVAIMQEYKKYANDYTHEELLATEILFYKFLLSMHNADPSLTTTDLVQSYSDEHKNKFISLKNTITSYHAIIIFLKKNEYNNLLSMNENDIDHVYQIYLSGKAIVPFNTKYFDSLMYNVDDITLKERELLQYDHYYVLSPIASFANQYYGTSDNDIKILSADSVIGNIGKIIIFLIEGVPSSNLYADINNNKIPIKNVKCDLKYPYIQLTIF